jgi:hypothetical protein
VIRQSRHVAEARLLDCYLNERDGVTVDPRVADHVNDCPSCGARYADLVQFMDGLRSEAARESDAVFTPERLRQQQQQIARRIEQASRLGRIIMFPGAIARRTFAVPTVRTAPRWIAAAAAAGLLIGVALGASYRWEPPGLRGVIRDRMTARSTATSPAISRSPSQDDEFMSELEVALDRPHTRELVAIDAFTPHFREIRTSQ